LAEVWTELKAGKLKIVSAKSADDYHLLVVRQAELTHDETPARNLQLLEQSVIAGSQQVGLDMAMSPSSVASAAKEARSWLGLRGKSPRLPPLLRFSILAHQRGSLVTAARRYQRNFVLSLPRPEGRLRASLNTHECQLLRLLVDGDSLLHIAEKRQIAARVAARPIADLCSRLGVRDRRQLYVLLFDLLEGDETRTG
jgi:DNA-binding CsgD family transcriptional regulator